MNMAKEFIIEPHPWAYSLGLIEDGEDPKDLSVLNPGHHVGLVSKEPSHAIMKVTSVTDASIYLAFGNGPLTITADRETGEIDPKESKL